MSPMKKTGARIRVRASQIHIIVEAMELNPFMNGNKVSATYMASKRNEDWQALAEKLNSMGGALKSLRVWQKCWSDKKSEVKKRHRLWKAAMLNAGTGHDEPVHLSPLEKRIIAVMGLDTSEQPNEDENKTMSEEPLQKENLDQPLVNTASKISDDFKPMQKETLDQPLVNTATEISDEFKVHVKKEFPDSPVDGTSCFTEPLVTSEQRQESEISDTPTSGSSCFTGLLVTSQLPQETIYLLPEKTAQLPIIEFSKTVSVPPEIKTPKSTDIGQRSLQQRKTKPVDLQQEKVPKLLEGEMAVALKRCAMALEKQNELIEQSLEIKKKKVDVMERTLNIKQKKADAFVAILSYLVKK